MAKSAVKELLKVARIRTMHGDLVFAKKNWRQGGSVPPPQAPAQALPPAPRHIKIKSPVQPSVPKPPPPKPKPEIVKPVSPQLPPAPKALSTEHPVAPAAVLLPEKDVTAIPVQETKSNATLSVSSSNNSQKLSNTPILAPVRKPAPPALKILALPPAREINQPVALLPADDSPASVAAPRVVPKKLPPAVPPPVPKISTSKPMTAPQPPAVAKDRRTTFLEDIERWTKDAQSMEKP